MEASLQVKRVPGVAIYSALETETNNPRKGRKTVLLAQRASQSAGHIVLTKGTDFYFQSYSALGKPVGIACKYSAPRVYLAVVPEVSAQS